MLPLFLGLRLSDVEFFGFLFVSLLLSDLFEGLLGILPVPKADKSEALVDVVLVLHDYC